MAKEAPSGNAVHIDPDYRDRFQYAVGRMLEDITLFFAGCAFPDDLTQSRRALKDIQNENRTAFNHLLGQMPETTFYEPENHGGRGRRMELNEHQVIKNLALFEEDER